jgi:hypothetical protein
MQLPADTGCPTLRTRTTQTTESTAIFSAEAIFRRRRKKMMFEDTSLLTVVLHYL